MNEKKKLIVITGCDSGIGECCTQRFSAAGYTVLVSYLEKHGFAQNSTVIAQKMDLKNSDDIAAFAGKAAGLVQEGYHLDCFIHNAGIALGGPAENLPLQVYRDVMEVNFFGIVDLTRRVLPALISCRSKLFIIGSLAGKIAAPFLSPYASSKFALEGYTDSLRRELDPLGIKTVLFEPSGVITPIWKKYDQIDMSGFDARYMQSLDAFKKNFVDKAADSLPCDSAARFIVRVFAKRNPRTRYLVAKDRFVSTLLQHLPDRIVDRLIRSVYRMNYGR